MAKKFSMRVFALVASVSLGVDVTASAQAQSLDNVLGRLLGADPLPDIGWVIPPHNPRHPRDLRPYDHPEHGEYHHRGETAYERQSRGLYRPGYDIDRVLENQYNGNRQ